MNLFKSFSIYVANNILNALIPFLLIPVLTSYLDPAQYGLLANVQAFMTFSLPFVMLAIPGAIGTAYYRNPRQELPSYLSAGLMTASFSAGIFMVVYLIATPFIRSILDIPAYWILVIPLISFVQTVCMVTLSIFQAGKQPLKYGFFQIGMTLTNFGLSLLFIAVFDMGWAGRILGIFSSFFLFSAAGILILASMKLITLRLERKHVKDILLFGIPMIPHMISGPVMQMLDRPLLTHYLSLEAAGLYTLAFQIGVAVNYAAEAFNKAWAPHLFEHLAKETQEIRIKMVKQSYLFIGVFMLLPLFLWLATPLIFKFFVSDPAFMRAQLYVLPVSVGAAFGGMYYTMSNYFFYEKKTWVLSATTFGSALVSITMNLLLIPRFGVMGAATSFVVSNFLLFIAVWILANRVHPMPWFFFLKKEKNQ